eukprot:476387-Rhodomonas_salina.1
MKLCASVGMGRQFPLGNVWRASVSSAVSANTQTLTLLCRLAKQLRSHQKLSIPFIRAPCRQGHWPGVKGARPECLPVVLVLLSRRWGHVISPHQLHTEEAQSKQKTSYLQPEQLRARSWKHLEVSNPSNHSHHSHRGTSTLDHPRFAA